MNAAHPIFKYTIPKQSKTLKIQRRVLRLIAAQLQVHAPSCSRTSRSSPAALRSRSAQVTPQEVQNEEKHQEKSVDARAFSIYLYILQSIQNFLCVAPPLSWPSCHYCGGVPGKSWGEQVRLSASPSSSAARRSWLYICLIYLGRVLRRHGGPAQPSRHGWSSARARTRTPPLLRIHLDGLEPLLIWLLSESGCHALVCFS